MQTKGYHTRLLRFLVATILPFCLAACEQEEHNGNGPDNSNDTIVTISAFVLNEGNMGPNNASLSALDPNNGWIDNEWFQRANDRKLGDQAQDMVRYGSRLYVTVTESNTLEAVSITTGQSLQTGMGSLKPRSIAADGGKLYITCYNPPCVVRVDTATLAIEDTCLLGSYRPEGIAIACGKAFVASSYSASNYYLKDDKVYVVALGSFTVDTTLTVGCNPSPMVQVDASTVAVGCLGDYEAIAATTAIIDAATLGVTPVDRGCTRMTVANGRVYSYDAPYGGTPSYAIIDADGTVSPFPFEPAIAGNPYAIAVDPTSGNIFVANDGNYRVPGDIYCFGPDGTLRYQIEAGQLPSKIVFIQ